MKKLKSNLFDKEKILKKVELSGICGGANKSDVNYTDSTYGRKYDIAILSTIDIIKTSQRLDKATIVLR